MFQKYRFHFLLHGIIFIWGFTGILGKLISVSEYELVWHRFLIAFVSLFIALLWLKKPMKIADKKLRWQVLGTGLIVAAHWITFYASIKISTASLGILCLSTTTLHVTWLEPLVFKKKFSWFQFSLGLLVVLGIYFVSADFKGTEVTALILGLSAALFAALFSVFNAKLAESVPSSSITLNEMGIGLVALSILLFSRGQLDTHLFQLSGSDFAWLLFLGIVCTSFAFLAMIEVVKRLGAFTVSLSINLEPVYTIVLAIPLLHENQLLNHKFYLGAAMIILVVSFNGIYKEFFTGKKSQ